MKSISKKILSWHESNKSTFPWKKTKDPYKIWVSEIILQQTRIHQGLPYYLQFVQKFPTVEALAKASEDEVLAVWKGLGYYTRARNMLATAKHIVANLNGNFPETYEGLLQLKGIGPYSAAAISSFAYGESRPVVDGNVIRLMCRYFTIEEYSSSAKALKKIIELTTQLISGADPASFNQAIMDFGSKQCVPKNPDCTSCPLKLGCKAFQKNLVDSFPLVKQKKAKKRRFFHYFVCRQNQEYLLGKRINKDIWQGLYEFPLLEKDSGEAEEEIYLFLKNKIGLSSSYNSLGMTQYKQHLSHQTIIANFYELEFEKLKWSNASYKLVEKHNLSNFAIPKIVDSYLKG